MGGSKNYTFLLRQIIEPLLALSFKNTVVQKTEFLEEP
jgi:hypothetical protein